MVAFDAKVTDYDHLREVTDFSLNNVSSSSKKRNRLKSPLEIQAKKNVLDRRKARAYQRMSKDEQSSYRKGKVMYYTSSIVYIQFIYISYNTCRIAISLE